MDTVVITLGRNIGGKPMDDTTWWHFKCAVGEALEYIGASILQKPQTNPAFDSDQIGVWDGKFEPACAYVCLLPSTAHKALKSELVDLKHEFQQEAVGYIVAEGESNII